MRNFVGLEASGYSDPCSNAGNTDGCTCSKSRAGRGHLGSELVHSL